MWSGIYVKKYRHYLDNHRDWYITRNRQSIVDLLTKANVEDCFLPHVEPIGYGQIQTGSISVFKNLAMLRVDVCGVVGQYLIEAQGVFKSRMLNSFNPIFWLEFVIFLPKNLLSYLGFKSEGTFVKLLQIAWWCIAAISTLAGIFFNKELVSFVSASFKVVGLK
jgi:hypothetical protein